MKANEMIKRYGLEVIKECAEMAKGDACGFKYYTDIGLYRLIESHDLIEKYKINKENINWMLSKLNSNARHRIMQAWADVESCQ